MEKGKRSKMVSTLASYAILLVIVGAIMYLNARSGGWDQVKNGFFAGGKQALKFTPLLMIIFIAMGQADVLIQKHDTEIKEGMSGERGLMASFVAGALSPGSIAGLKPAQEMWEVGGYNKRAIFIFILASMLVNVQTTVMRGGFMGWKLTVIMYGVCLAMGLSVLLAFWIWEKVFG
jgi:hypothetical protein